MNAGLDQQFGDLIWCLSTGLRAGYSLHQVFETLSADSPEPAAAACKLLLVELDKGMDVGTALSNWKQALPSVPLARLVDVMVYHHHNGGSLANLLDPLSAELIIEFGSDPAFYEAMRGEAEQLGAKIPERIISWKDSAE